MIYAIWAKGTDFVKIGYTGGYRRTKRLRDMQVGCPHELELLVFAEGSEQDEKAFHAMLASEHVRGEWFRWGQKVKSVVDTLKGSPAPKPAWHKNNGNAHRRLGAALSVAYGKPIHKS